MFQLNEDEDLLLLNYKRPRSNLIHINNSQFSYESEKVLKEFIDQYCTQAYPYHSFISAYVRSDSLINKQLIIESSGCIKSILDAHEIKYTCHKNIYMLSVSYETLNKLLTMSLDGCTITFQLKENCYTGTNIKSIIENAVQRYKNIYSNYVQEPTHVRYRGTQLYLHLLSQDCIMEKTKRYFRKPLFNLTYKDYEIKIIDGTHGATKIIMVKNNEQLSHHAYEQYCKLS